MRAIFWPTASNPNPSALTRFGRVIHWIGATIAGLLFVAVAFALLAEDTPMWDGVIVVGFWLIVIYFGARGLRYILSAE